MPEEIDYQKAYARARDGWSNRRDLVKRAERELTESAEAWLNSLGIVDGTQITLKVEGFANPRWQIHRSHPYVGKHGVLYDLSQLPARGSTSLATATKRNWVRLSILAIVQAFLGIRSDSEGRDEREEQPEAQ